MTKRRLLIVFSVAVLMLGLAVPAAAKKGGIPGPPSGSDLEVTMTVDTLGWANSVGDVISFEILITNNGSADLTITSVEFEETPVPVGSGSPANGVLQKNESWITIYPYTTTLSDFDGMPFQENTEVPKPVVVEAAIGEGTLPESATAAMTVHPIAPCRATGTGQFTVGPVAEYTVCSDGFAGAEVWKLVVTGTKRPGKKMPFVTMRDGVPGNWCMGVPGYADDDAGWVTPTGGIQFVYFPSDGTCLGGGAGGDTIPTRNSTLFFLAYNKNSVTAIPCTNGVELAGEKLACKP